MIRLRSDLLNTAKKGGRALAAALLFGVTVLSGTLGGSMAYAMDSAEWVDGEGIVQEVSLADSTVIISGFQYRVVPHARVQVRGNASSLAGLVAGMQVQFRYEMFEGLKASVSAIEEGMVIHELEQLPDNVEILQF